jgi:ABC-type transporter lipoprotein component MlaA
MNQSNKLHKICKVFSCLFFCYFFTCFCNIARADEAEDDEFLNQYQSKAISNKNATKSQPAVKDPLEKINRTTFFIYDNLDKYALSHIAHLYLFTTPKPVRQKISSLRGTLGEPVSLVNAIVSRHEDGIAASLNRFLLNLSFGLFFKKDLATEIGIKEFDVTFADVLRSFGVPNGPYFISPIGGMPGNLIDAGSMMQSMFVSVYDFNGLNTINRYRVFGTIITARADVDDIITNARRSSLDLYSAQRGFFFAMSAKRAMQKAMEAKQREALHVSDISAYHNHLFFNPRADYFY